MDINMPLMNGYDCTKRIRAYGKEIKNINDDSKNISFIIGVSGNCDEGYIR